MQDPRGHTHFSAQNLSTGTDSDAGLLWIDRRRIIDVSLGLKPVLRVVYVEWKIINPTIRACMVWRGILQRDRHVDAAGAADAAQARTADVVICWRRDNNMRTPLRK